MGLWSDFLKVEKCYPQIRLSLSFIPNCTYRLHPINKMILYAVTQIM